MSNRMNGLRTFDDFRLDVNNGELKHDNDPVIIAPKAIELLIRLTSQPGEIIKKETLVREIWPDSDPGENSLAHAVHQLRKSFQQYSDTEYIITVPRRGYRFVGDVTNIDLTQVSKEGNVETLATTDHPRLEKQFSELPVKTPSQKNKNYRAIFLLCICLLGIIGIFLAGAWFSRSPQQTASLNSIAILPLMTFDGLDNDLGLRLADSVITRLNRLDGINVRPTSAISGFTGDRPELADIGKRLKVDLVIDGRVHQEGEAIRVTIQAVSVSTGDLLWSDQFNGKPDRLLDLQDSITERLSFHLSKQINQDKNIVLAKRPTSNPEAYELYLTARFFWQKRSYDSLKNGRSAL